MPAMAQTAFASAEENLEHLPKRNTFKQSLLRWNWRRIQLRLILDKQVNQEFFSVVEKVLTAVVYATASNIPDVPD